MKSFITLLGVLLIVFGIGVFAYKGFTYTSEDKIAQVGNVEVTANTEKTVYFQPLTGAIALVAGVVLVLAGRRK